MKLFGEKYQDKIIPIPEGVNYEYLENKAVTPLNNAFNKMEYFMYVGNFYPHKNVKSLIKAYAQVDTNKKLLLIGPEDFFTKRLKSYVDELNQNERILFINKPPISELIYYYKNALALIHPSKTEGFCLPLVEAAHFKLPIIGSNIPVFREVIGEQFVAFDPYDVDDITFKINDFLKSKKHQIPQLKQEFSFKYMTECILDLYKKI